MAEPSAGCPTTTDADIDDLERTRYAFRILELHLFFLILLPLAVLLTIVLGRIAGLPPGVQDVLGFAAFICVSMISYVAHKRLEYRYLVEIKQIAAWLLSRLWFIKFIGAIEKTKLNGKSVFLFLVFYALLEISASLASLAVSVAFNLEINLLVMPYPLDAILSFALLLVSFDLTVVTLGHIEGRSSRDRSD